MAMAFLFLKEVFGKSAYKNHIFLNLFLQGVQANLVLKHVFGHRPCPIAYSAFKSVLIITNFSILLSKHFNQCYNFVLLRALACFVLKT